MPTIRKNSGMDVLTDFSTPAGYIGQISPPRKCRQSALLCKLRIPFLSPFNNKAAERAVLDVLRDLGTLCSLLEVGFANKNDPSAFSKTRIIREVNRRAERTAIIGLSSELIVFILSIRVLFMLFIIDYLSWKVKGNLGIILNNLGKSL
jgi:hypothetical protein